ncbi:conserved hypothetical protein [Coccidioides posadasii str. Silveira]|uniref:Ferric oxidoreductase domain-containing protein n=2 Tax=Coccidioides posadasii TaxID=199306 RepID=E9CZT9_COCPS|nr:conserved hypothetical protein [Coccidioides posadasii str. Silveira]
MQSSFWPYRFVSLSQSQSQERREILDHRGIIAQVSALIVLVGVSLYRHAVLGSTSGTSRGKKGEKAWLDRPPFKGWRETRRQCLLTIVWAVWLVGLSSWRTGDDYLHLTKSLAHTTMATVPLQIILSPKLSTRTNPLLRLLGLPQSILTPYHRLYGRIVLFPLLTSHALLYTAFFILQSLFSKRINDADVQWGVTGIFLAWIIWSMSSGGKSLTKRQFYVGHVVMVMGLFAVAYFHVIYVRRYVLEAVGIYVLDVSWYAIGKAWSGSKGY